MNHIASSRTREILGHPLLWYISVFIFRGVLDAIYYLWISVHASGDGFIWDPAASRLTESFLALAVATYFTPQRVERLTDFLIFVLFVLCIVPLTSYYGLNQVVVSDSFNRVVFWNIIFQFLLFRLIVWMLCEYGPEMLKKPRFAVWGAYGVLILVVGYAVGYLIATRAAHFFVLGFDDIYARRSEVASLIDGGLIAYLISWLQKVCGIYLLMVALNRWNLLLAVVSGGLIMFLFGVLAHKAILFALIVTIGILVVWRLITVSAAICVALISLFLVALAVGYLVFGTTNLYLSIFSRRLLFVPARLDFIYFEFFAAHGPLYFSGGFLRSLIEYPFAKNYALVIGEFAQMGGDDTAANNGFLATGYMQLGWLGTFVYPVIVAVLCWLADVLSKGASLKHVAAVCFYPFAALFTSADLPTSILTHGIGLLLILLWLDSWGLRAHCSSNGRSIE